MSGQTDGQSLIDTHAHLDMIDTDPERIRSVVERAQNEGVSDILSVGIDVASSRKAVAISKELAGVHASVGIHPNDANEFGREAMEELTMLSDSPAVRAWGEIGLDYYRDRVPRQVQKKAFEAQLQAAMDRALPVIVHARDALDDCIEIMRGFLATGRLTGVFHCFSGSVEHAKRVLDLGFLVSFTGVVTFPKAEEVRQVVAYVPLERMLVETDSPFLSPVPFRGKPNEPARVRYVAQAIASVKGIEYAEVASCTSRNARDLFALSER